MRAALQADDVRPVAANAGRVAGLGPSTVARSLILRLGRISAAAEVLARSPARLDHARVVVDLGVRARQAGARIRAREHLQTGLELARACGATALTIRAHDELRVAGARPRQLQFSGVEALTASERRVCDLAAAGRSNREIAQELFVTPKTVENHLGRAYGKLGIGSRDELAETIGVAGH